MYVQASIPLLFGVCLELSKKIQNLQIFWWMCFKLCLFECINCEFLLLLIVFGVCALIFVNFNFNFFGVCVYLEASIFVCI